MVVKSGVPFLRKAIKAIRAASQAERQELLKGQEHKFLVSVNGGRYDCDLVDLVKRPIYWTEKKLEKIRRCLWFYKENHDQIYVPYEEEYSEFLEVSSGLELRFQD